MRKKIVVLLLCGVLGGMTGCSSGGVSQEQYDRIVNEKDELEKEVQEMKEQYEELVANMNKVEEQSAEITNNSGKKDETSNSDKEENLDQAIEVIAEYTVTDSIGWYTRRYMIVKNNSNSTVDISTSSLAYGGDGTMVSEAKGSLYALGSGCTSIMYEAFETNAQIATYETTTNVSISKHMESVIQDLSFVQNNIEGGAVFQVTNNGQGAAEFVEGYALFFLGDNLVDCQSTYFTDDDSEIKPGATISEQITAYEDYDRIEFYLTGRRDVW